MSSMLTGIELLAITLSGFGDAALQAESFDELFMLNNIHSHGQIFVSF